MREYDTLKKSAEAVPHKAWHRSQDWHDNIAEKIGPYVYARHMGAVSAVPRESAQFSVADKYANYIAAADPATVLGLLGDVERLRRLRDTLTTRASEGTPVCPDELREMAERIEQQETE